MLEPGGSYIQLSAGGSDTVLLRSDGRAVACGNNRGGKRDIPEPEPGVTYIRNGIIRDLVVQLFVERRGDDIAAVVRNLTGSAIAMLTIAGEPPHEPAMSRVRSEVSRPGMRLRVVLSDGAFLSEQCTWEELLQR
mmetsp:Transcript_71009/g.196598  ORF Transcript_71009/g.196598 Transcript_71009/m.196598 type:complete len:135 (+) Transcript_71009:3-407(+)